MSVDFWRRIKKWFLQPKAVWFKSLNCSFKAPFDYIHVMITKPVPHQAQPSVLETSFASLAKWTFLNISRREGVDTLALHPADTPVKCPTTNSKDDVYRLVKVVKSWQHRVTRSTRNIFQKLFFYISFGDANDAPKHCPDTLTTMSRLWEIRNCHRRWRNWG